MLERIGGFDTRFAVGNLEDDDYSLRARLAGFRLWIADDSLLPERGFDPQRDRVPIDSRIPASRR